MSSRPLLGHAALVGVTAALTSWAALAGWRGFVVDSTPYLAPLLLVALAVGLLGAGLRWLGTPALVTVAAQLVVAVAMTSSELGGSPLPTGGAADRIATSVREAIDSAQAYAAPVPPDVAPITPLLLIGGVFFVLLVDVLACTLRRVPLAGLALLAIYSVPAGVVQSGPGWLPFLGAATGFLALLHLDAREHLLRWGRPLGPREDSPWSDANPLAEAFRFGAGRIGISATALALVTAPLVPVLDLDVLGFGPGDGDDEIKIEKPIVDMRRDLEQGADIPLVRVTTDDPVPEYLRVGVLNRFTGVEWSSGNRVVTGGPDGDLPEPPGLSSSVPRRSYDYEIEVAEEFVSTWLPTQYPAESLVAEGDWQYDPSTLDFVADGGQTTAGMSYSMTALEPLYGTTGAYFEDSLPSDVDEESLALPSGIPSEVSSWAFRVTAGATSDYERALLLQSWFREEGGFRYSLERAPEGTGGETLEAFLSEEGRVGYCEQYASAMAVMARYLGIPARVAVGFLSPTQAGPGEFVYSTDDLHAWPELYFAGAGWVRFEPTPSRRAETVPDYTQVAVDIEQLPTNSQASEATDRPSGSRPEDESSSAAPQEQSSADGAGGDDATDWRAVLLRTLAGLVVLAALVALALAPRTYRGVLRRRRLSGGPDEVWSELRATALDLELPWPDGRSPREIGVVLADRLGDPHAPSSSERPRTGPAVHLPATQALDDLVDAVELQRYALPGRAPSTGLGERAETCIGSLLAGATRPQRLRATWLPRSLAERRPAAVEIAERRPERV